MGRSICNVTPGHEHSEANALLICAAPDIAAALQACLEAINPPDRAGISLHEWNKRLKAASEIARAALACTEQET
jgi:hypothetical protein